MQGGAAHVDYLQELKEAGANTARIYDTINLKYTLDTAEELGLAIVVDIPLPQYHKYPEFYEDEALFEEMKAKIKLVVEQHKDHPALLYWNLGNELHYPYFYKRTKFHSNFNVLIDLLHEIDPNHPVSTTTIGANKLLVFSIITKSPQLDFISFNSFGTLSEFEKKLRPLSPIWTGPYAITEWGVNGGWEAQTTAWQVPREETSTKKAEQIKQRHQDFIAPLATKNSLGSFIFYWGQKDEVTPTWYSLFGSGKLKTQPVYELSKIWNGSTEAYPGPELDYVMLNGKGALESVIVSPGTQVEVEVFLPKDQIQDLEYTWELRHESWDNRLRSFLVEEMKFKKNETKALFQAPNEDGPYRVFVYLSNGSDYIATANFPFYVLNPDNGE